MLDQRYKAVLPFSHWESHMQEKDAYIYTIFVFNRVKNL